MTRRKLVAQAGMLTVVGLVPTAALAIPEGTPQLGPTQGLAGYSILRVDVLAAGETLRLCSSDDGFKEADAGGFRLENNPPGAANPIVEPRRIGAEMLIAPPSLTFCADDTACDPGYHCYTSDLFPVVVGGVGGVCALPLPVVHNGQGYCDWNSGAGNWQTHVAEEAGSWWVNFVSEPETLTGSNESTRFFAVDVQRANGVAAPGGRLHAPVWRVNAHQFSYGTNADFFVVSPVISANVTGAKVFVIDFQNTQGFQYQVLANTQGISGHASTSWCQFGDPNAVSRDCPLFGDGPTHSALVDYDIYLNYPDSAPPPAPSPVLSNVAFNDSVGTKTITPNGDHNQDSGDFSFDSNVSGTFRIVIDTDRNGTFDNLADRVITGTAAPGANRATWDGRDRNGVVVPDGDYTFDVELITAETHFPMVDIERNLEGFTIWEQGGAAAARTPRQMYWDDTHIRGDADLLPGGDDALETIPEGSVIPVNGDVRHQRRYWKQPTRLNANTGANEDIPQIYDTWVQGENDQANEATCQLCQGPFQAVTVGGADEVFDSDGDGILDNAEDANGDGIVQPNESNPHAADTDGDGIPDGIEDANHNGVRDPGETNPNNVDSDGDGIQDGVEDANHDGVVDAGETDPRAADTDGDGISDGTEDSTGTNPLNVDSDGDGLSDGAEDANHNGHVDMGETDPRDRDSDNDLIPDNIEVNGGTGTSPTSPDSDGDGIPDGIEDANQNGVVDPGETNPALADSDMDGIPDGIEDTNHNGVVDGTETNPINADTDGDGIADGAEDLNHNGVHDAGESDPRVSDTDHDGLADGVEDANHNGVVDAGETSADNADTDGGGEPDGSEVQGGRDPLVAGDDQRMSNDADNDGLTDAEEDPNGNGTHEPGETDPNVADTDGDGILDGTEVHGTNPTSPITPDTDRDGIPDGLEDANHNGALDPGETNPNAADSDGDGIADGLEDVNHNGTVDEGETNPREADTDGDGLDDGLEDANQNGVVDDGETNPRLPDTDHDGLTDGAEDANHNGTVDAGETDPLNPDTDGGGETDGSEVAAGHDPVGDPTDDVAQDTDGDGLPDFVEDANGDGVFNAGETNPNNADTDADGLPDGIEDANHNGVVDHGETDPRVADTDADGLNDGQEDTNHNGSVDDGETDPRVADTDHDGLDDGVEVNGTNHTDPTDPDTDNDGVCDGPNDVLPTCKAGEDLNRNGGFDPGESDPNNADTDGDGIPDGQDTDPLEGNTDAGVGTDAGTSNRLDFSGTNPADGCSVAFGARQTAPVATVLPILLLAAMRRRRR